MEHRILVVCTANVCRSPMVAAMLQHRLADQGLVIESAGVRAPVGRPMDADSAAQLSNRGIAVPGGSARQLTPDIVAAADLVLTATRPHRADVLDLHPRSLRRTFTVVEFAALCELVEGSSLGDLISAAATARSRGPQDVDLRDPIGQPPEVHAEVARVADAAVATIAARLGDVGGQ